MGALRPAENTSRDDNSRDPQSRPEPLSGSVWMTSVGAHIAAMPLIQRFAIVGSTIALLLGGLVGLILGLRTFPPTAWVAVFEVGIPAGILGAILGTFVGVVTRAVRRFNRP